MASEEVARDVLQRTFVKGGRYRQAVIVLAAVFLLGVVGFILKLGQDRTQWGYYAATFSYLFTVAQTAPVVSVAMRLAKNHWRRPLARASELFAVVGLFNLLLFIPLLILLPSIEGRNTIWILGVWPSRFYTPHIFDTLMLVGLVVLGLLFLWTAAVPDFAAARDQRGGQGRYAFLAMGWQGTVRQWRVQRALLGLLGGLYFMDVLTTHFLIASDFSMGLVPGWVDSIYPAFHAITGLQAAVAVTIVTMFLLRTVGGYREYLPMESFWGLSKILLALSLMWFYFWWSAFITFWYGRMPVEQNIVQLIMFGPYRPFFVTAFLFCCIFAIGLLIWNPLRKSPAALAAIATMILVGGFFDRMRLYVSSWSLATTTDHTLTTVPAAIWPQVPDLLVIAGGLAGAVLVYLLATRIVPVMSIWEMKELRLYQVPRQLVRRRMLSLGKPD